MTRKKIDERGRSAAALDGSGITEPDDLLAVMSAYGFSPDLPESFETFRTAASNADRAHDPLKTKVRDSRSSLASYAICPVTDPCPDLSFSKQTIYPPIQKNPEDPE
jgi:hypothetical protein